MIQDLIDPDKYDIVFMDIKLKEDDNGIFTSQVIKDILPSVILIFVSGYDYRSVMGRAEAFGYLNKPVDKNELYDLLEHAERRINTMRMYYPVITKGITYRINLHRTSYIVSNLRTILFKMRDGSEYQCYNKLDELYQELLLLYPYFIRTSKSYIINYNYIESVSRTEVNISGTSIPITKKYDEYFRKRIKELRKWKR